MKTLVSKIIVVLFILLSPGMTDVVSQQKPKEQDKYLESPELLITELYSSVTFNPGKFPDWEKVRAMFLTNAVVVLRTSRTATSIFTVQGFIDDFVNFIEKTKAKEKGFGESILKMKSVVVGDIAHVLILYDAQIYGITIPPQKGVDSWQLIKKDNRWWIVSITNEIISAKVPIPEELK